MHQHFVVVMIFHVGHRPHFGEQCVPRAVTTRRCPFHVINRDRDACTPDRFPMAGTSGLANSRQVLRARQQLVFGTLSALASRQNSKHSTAATSPSIPRECVRVSRSLGHRLRQADEREKMPHGAHTIGPLAANRRPTNCTATNTASTKNPP